MTEHLFPLERLLEYHQKNSADKFPRPAINYFAQYKEILRNLRLNYYTKVDSGLSANSIEPGLYTAHDAEHFDHVVLHASKLLGCNDDTLSGHGNAPALKLSPYEVYVLLVAIRIHDVGNMLGRDLHERKCFQILKSLGTVSGNDDPEKRMIAKIAEAHGGKTDSGSKDTIATLDRTVDSASEVVRPRLLAGITRIADEICENSSRSANVLLDYEALPHQSQIYHKYASSICANKWEPADRTMRLRYEIKLTDLAKAWGCARSDPVTKAPITQTYLFNEIVERLLKMNSERKYCNIYTKEVITIDGIVASINVYGEDNLNPIKKIAIDDLSDSGYPEDSARPTQFGKLAEYLDPKYWNQLQVV